MQHPVVLMHNQPAGNPATAARPADDHQLLPRPRLHLRQSAGDTGLGYLALTSDGGVRNFGTTWHGSDRGSLAAGVTAVGLAADPATGGYWVAEVQRRGG